MKTDNEVNIEVVKILRNAGLTTHQGTVVPALGMLRAVWRSFEPADPDPFIAGREYQRKLDAKIARDIADDDEEYDETAWRVANEIERATND